MNDKPNFASILDEAPTEIDRPKPIPTGTYLCRVQGTPTYDKSSKKGTPFVQFTLKPISAEETSMKTTSPRWVGSTTRPCA
jgi:hypothetical protein